MASLVQFIRLHNKTVFVKLQAISEDTLESRSGVTGGIGHFWQTLPTKKKKKDESKIHEQNI